jgi:hypothetical protein
LQSLASGLEGDHRVVLSLDGAREVGARLSDGRMAQPVADGVQRHSPLQPTGACIAA